MTADRESGPARPGWRRHMGRELRRVPLDFSWPRHKVWRGFINPHWKPCPEAAKDRCHAGTSNAGMWMDALTRLICVLGEEARSAPERREHLRRTGRGAHRYLEEWPMAPRTDVPYEVHKELRDVEDRGEGWRRMNAYLRANPPQLLELDGEIAALVQGLAGGKTGSYGADTWAIRQSLLGAAGIEDERWGVCKVCDGHGMDPTVVEAYEAWEPEQPPAGEGWQLWETVSEGSPISPVFPTEDAFIDYLVSKGYSQTAAETFAKRGWAPSFVAHVDAGGEAQIFRDIEALGDKAEVDHG